MKIINSTREMKSWRQSNQNIGFVPTMGGLHQGHLSLIERSLSENSNTVVSLFLNATQFNDSSDLENYPSNLQNDIQLLQETGCQCVFTPNFDQIYPDNYRYVLSENTDSKDLCGKDRPGHFDGVLTVVLKLFNIVKPNRSYFGEKDYQQLKLIEGMVKALFLDIEIVPCPIVRDEKGLALSSRNSLLSKDGLEKARSFANLLQTSKELENLTTRLNEQAIEIDYLQDIDDRRFAAVRIEEVRLIDNVGI